MKKIASVIAVVVILWVLFAPQPQAKWNGQLVPGDPVQNSDALPAPWVRGKYTFTPKARYQVKAVVLSKHHYWAGADEDEIAPYDLALGWGPMSDAGVINTLRISQSGRWYNYFWKGSPPLDLNEIVRHSSNHHIVHADRQVLSQVSAVQKLDLVSMKGYLVDVSRADGWAWTSSLSREDNRGGSCELFWVEDIERVRRP
jgi:hypothetical protein